MDNTPRTPYTDQKVKTVQTLELSCPSMDQNVLFEHPRVFLKMKNNRVTCPYCETTYVFGEPDHE